MKQSKRFGKVWRNKLVESKYTVLENSYNDLNARYTEQKNN